MAAIFCKKCRQSFEPDPRTRGKWICSHCGAKNLNFRRHYRSIGDLFILGLLISAALFYFGPPKQFDLFWVLLSADDALLLVTIVAIYRSKAPWASATVRSLIWTVFVIAFLGNVGVPLLKGRLVIPAVILYALLFPYLFWLHWRSNQANAAEPARVTPNELPAGNERGRAGLST
jgi:hypothetical protein